jgi:hypothetical protein
MNPSRLAVPLLIAICLPLLTGGCGLPLAATAASTAADGASYATTNKSTFDHFTSMVSKKDCAALRMLDNNKICREREDGHDPYSVSYSDPFRSAGEGGVEYSAPLESAANAPAASWDAAAYKAPAPVASPAEPPTALANTQAAPAPAATPATHVRKKQPAARMPKKPAQGQVASRP